MLLSALTLAGAEKTWNYTVQISATIQESPPKITLSWPQDDNGANNYTVYRKGVNDGSWGSGTTLSGSTTTYADNNVTAGTIYEYRIVKAATLGYSGYGYICAGINAPLRESRGKVVLLVDNTYTTSLSTELALLQSDLVGDGWTVLRHDVSRSATPSSVRDIIRADYNADSQNVKAVFLFGHVPILRSGNLNIDGHQARPVPADGYYGDMDGTWNNPDYLPSDVELMVGRVDLWNMPGTYATSPWPSELEMLRNYLNKDHRWRHKMFTTPRRALVGNRFGDFGGEGFAASGFRNFEPFVGPGNISQANEQDSAPANQKWGPMLGASSYLWAYGCGGGSYTSMSGMGTTGQYGDVTSYDIIGLDAKAVFYMMFGSWLGEWDTKDNIMRSALATSSMGLTCSWAGRPHWYYHHMALGEVIGYSARLSMNNSSMYQNQVNRFTRGVHIALMGDPTLRMHPVAPPTNVRGNTGSSGASLTWSASSDNVAGYHVYRASSTAGAFTRVSSSLVSGTSFNDPSATSGTYTYMVRAVKLESTPSGTYYNPSQGVFTTADGTGPSLPVVSIIATDANAAEAGSESGTFTISRTGATTSALTVNYTLSGTAVNGTDYNSLGTSTTIPAGAGSTSVTVRPIDDTLVESAETVILTVNSTAAYTVDSSVTATVTIADNDTTNPPADTTAPTVAITQPSGNASVSGISVAVTANASDNVGVAGVQFQLDGANLSGEITTLPATQYWNTTFAADGLHRLSAIARDAAGNRATSAVVSVTVNNSGSTTNPPPVVVWLDDEIPYGGTPSADGGDSWNWVSSNPAPFAGSVAHQSTGTENQEHMFSHAWVTLPVNTNDVLFTHIYINPTNRPLQIMLQWNDNTWEHRAYWGASINTYGVEGSASRRYMGPLPPAGQWVRLEVPAKAVALEGSVLKGMAFTLVGGQATWDYAGKLSALSVNSNPSGTNATARGDNIWVDDGIPYGATTTSTGGDSWNWVNNNPTPFYGNTAHQSTGTGIQEHSFNHAWITMSIDAGDVLFTYVYLDPANKPDEIMLQWTDGSWDHRAYWGTNIINYGTDGTVSRRYMGPLPPAGEWVRLKIPASMVGLEGQGR